MGTDRQLIAESGSMTAPGQSRGVCERDSTDTGSRGFGRSTLAGAPLADGQWRLVAGAMRLSARESEIIACFSEGRTESQTAAALGISPRTMHAHAAVPQARCPQPRRAPGAGAASVDSGLRRQRRGADAENPSPPAVGCRLISRLAGHLPDWTIVGQFRSRGQNGCADAGARSGRTVRVIS